MAWTDEGALEVEGRVPAVIKDTFSGFSGGRAPQALYSQVASVVNLLSYTPYRPLRITRIECDTQVRPGRRTADIEAVELDSDTYAPGEEVRAAVFVRPFKGALQRLRVALKLPADLPEGGYVATVCDGLLNARLTQGDNPTLSNPLNLEQVLEALRVQTGARRTHLVLRVPVGPAGVALGEKALPDLPDSMVHVLGHGRRTGAQTMSRALVSQRPTGWVLHGSETARFTVAKNKKVTRENDQ